MLSKAQATHSFNFFCAYIVKKRLPHALKKSWITTAILRPMYSKDKLPRKYLNQKRFLINAVLHEIFKRNKNTIKKLLRTPLLQPLLHPGSK